MKPMPMPAMTRAQINMLAFWLPAMRAAPRIPNTVPMRTPPLRPILSPTHPVAATLVSNHRPVLCCYRTWALFLQRIVLCRTAYKAPPHASEIIRCGKPALFGRVGYDPIVANISHLDEARRGANSSKDTLIVSCLSFKKGLKLAFSIMSRLGL